MTTISALYIYPIKSLGGIQLNTSNITRRGLENDRSWMLVDDNNQFLSQRTFPEMALLKTGIEEDNILVHHLQDPSDVIKVPLHPSASNVLSVKVWDDYCEAQVADDNINQWFSTKLGVSCKAVYMMENFERKLDSRYAIDENNVTSFSDGYPILMVSEASLEDLNNKLEFAIEMDRFRPNIVIAGTKAFAEDEMKKFSINNLGFFGVKLCGRCPITTTDQQTGQRGKEPLKTLATYRTINNKVCFGQNVIPAGIGSIAVGDDVHSMDH
ncbi:MAG: MOSC domain-containing protein [Chitinophagaceae bacterium]|nr:MAG: MOSC domain-containing protein [Chitinophagaceae bacterium]